jgi:PAS domain S-box-containing protein
MAKRATPTLTTGHATLLLGQKGDAEPAPWMLDFEPPAMLVDQPLVGLFVLQNETFTWCNEAYAGYFGYRADELIGQHISKVCTPESLPVAREWHNMRERGEAQTMHYLIEGRTREGKPVFLENQGTRVMYRGKPAVAAVLVNITERVLRERELKRATARLRALTRNLMDVRERRRGEIARDLHDVLGGILTSLKMDLSRLARRQQSPELRDLAEEIMLLAQQGIEEIHRISRELRPAVLEHLGLGAAVAEALAKFGQRYSINVELKAAGPEPPLDPLQIASVFRVFQELLTNVARHAGASRVEVTLNVDDVGLLLEVSDNGRGMTVEQRESPNAFGILGMRERAGQLHGELAFAERPGGGTTVTLRVPLAHRKGTR